METSRGAISSVRWQGSAHKQTVARAVVCKGGWALLSVVYYWGANGEKMGPAAAIIGTQRNWLLLLL